MTARALSEIGSSVLLVVTTNTKSEVCSDKTYDDVLFELNMASVEYNMHRIREAWTLMRLNPSPYRNRLGNHEETVNSVFVEDYEEVDWLREGF